MCEGGWIRRLSFSKVRAAMVGIVAGRAMVSKQPPRVYRSRIDTGRHFQYRSLSCPFSAYTDPLQQRHDMKKEPES